MLDADVKKYTALAKKVERAESLLAQLFNSLLKIVRRLPDSWLREKCQYHGKEGYISVSVMSHKTLHIWLDVEGKYESIYINPYTASARELFRAYEILKETGFLSMLAKRLELLLGDRFPELVNTLNVLASEL